MMRFANEKEFEQFLSTRTTSPKQKKLKEWEKPPKPKKEISAHAIALAGLAKNPDLEKGKGEYFQQVRVFDYFERYNPDDIYELLHSIPNGGLRSKGTAAQMKAEGQKPGYPDMGLDAARGIYHGLRIELKHGKNIASEEQKGWQVRLTKEGYCALILFDWERAVEAILTYWNLGKGESLPEFFNDPKFDISQMTKRYLGGSRNV